jgi:hypothetical protein
MGYFLMTGDETSDHACRSLRRIPREGLVASSSSATLSPTLTRSDPSWLPGTGRPAVTPRPLILSSSKDAATPGGSGAYGESSPEMRPRS